MFLKRVELAGFKSFADRTVIEFEPGVTAVVGPNGSGKSNITEAIRWVLGEQSAKSLRGGKMPDIIFAGSETRKPVNIAEVTIVLDNSDRYLPLGFTEVSVTRRYRRSGESDFFINKQSCRLKDIQELFMDSGLGRESFSIISQGKIEAIFSSKPADRRGIFEEAAGVLKYKQRKHKAEQKLFETEDNLSRVQDIIYELEEQLTPLAAQSKAAKEFLLLKEELTAEDVALTVHEIAQLKAKFDQGNAEAEKISGALSQTEAKIQLVEGRLGKLRGKRQQLDASLEKGQQHILHLTEALKQAEGQLQVLAERSKNTQKNSSDYQASLTAQQEKAAAFEKAALELEQRRQQRVAEIHEQTRLIRELQQETAKYQRSSKEVMEDLRGQYVELMQEAASVSNEVKHLERQYQQETTKNQQTLAKGEQLQEAAAELTEKDAKAAAELSRQQELLDTLKAAYMKAYEQQRQQQQEYQQAQKRMFDLMSQAQQAKAKQKSLQEIRDNYAGFYQGVRLVLQHKEKLSGIVGAVAELIEVPQDYTLAIETALGGAAQHIIVETEADGRKGITYLKQQRGGRGTFLPLTSIRPRKLGQAQKERLSQLTGCLGVASELVSYPEKIQSVVWNLLGTVVIAQDLDSANVIARTLNYQYRVVSLEGDVMNAGGSMTGGATKRGNQGSLFAQNQELQQLTEHSAALEAALVQAETAVKDCERQLKKADLSVEELREKGEAARLSLQQLENQKNNLAEKLEHNTKELRLYTYETKEVQSFLADYQTQKEQLSARQTEIEAEKLLIDQELKDLDQESSRLAEKRQELSASLAKAEQKLAIKKEQAAHLAEQKEQADRQLKEATQQAAVLKAQISALSADFSTHEESEESLQQKAADLAQALTAEQTAVQQQKTERTQQQAAIDRDEAALNTSYEEQKRWLNRQSENDVRRNRWELQLDQQLAYLQEEYAQTFEFATSQVEPVSDPERSRQQVRQLKRQIEALGPVNLTAIEQYEQVNERYEFLVSQQEDLLSAKEQLFETMAEMDDEVKLRFKETFEEIRQKFKTVFPNMFGGGKAELLLTDPHDLLNTGIEIEVQPPGKKLQSLSLLSGGERSLTAIALLFSIIQVRPVPFCILDEVEAALDEANVARFGRYLSAFQNDTQFIVVTHRKGTMEAADILYGVTMQESGVSKIVSVRVEDVTDEGKINSGGTTHD